MGGSAFNCSDSLLTSPAKFHLPAKYYFIGVLSFCVLKNHLFIAVVCMCVIAVVFNLKYI